MAKVRLVAESNATGVAPVPERVTVWGLPLALSLMVSMPVRVPETIGVKVTPIMQVARDASGPPVEGQVLAVLSRAKSPLTVIELMLSGPSPLLVRVTLCAVLVEFNI